MWRIHRLRGLLLLLHFLFLTFLIDTKSDKCISNVVHNSTYEIKKMVPSPMERYFIDKMDNIHPFHTTQIDVIVEFLINQEACVREGDEKLQLYIKGVDEMAQGLKGNETDLYGNANDFSSSFTPYLETFTCGREVCNVTVSLPSEMGRSVYNIVGSTTLTIYHTIEYEVVEKFIPSYPSKFFLQYEDTSVDVNVGVGSYLIPSWESNFGIQAHGVVPKWQIRIGKYTSIADRLRIILGGDWGHNYRSPTTYPFGVLTKDENYIRKSQKNRTTLFIGNDVWIGDSVSIIGAISISDGAVIEANAVIRADVPPYAIVMGNPAIIVGYRFNELQIQKLLKIKWWNWNFEDILDSKFYELEPYEFLDKYYDIHNNDDIDNGSIQGDTHNDDDNNDRSITRTLDLGCGSSPINPYNATIVYGIDLAEVEPVSTREDGSERETTSNSKDSSSRYNENIKIVDLAVEKIPFPSDYFDYITAKDFLEHIPRVLYISEYDLSSNHNGKPMKIVRKNSFIDLMEEIYRVLKPNGLFYSATPVYPHNAAFQDPTHINYLTPETFYYYFDDETRFGYRYYNYTGGFKIDYMAQDDYLLVVKMLKTPRKELRKLEELEITVNHI